jgi:hypothetical protein
VVFLHQRMKRLIDACNPKSLKEATEIGIQLLPYLRPRLSTQNVTTELKTQHVIRVPAKADSIEQWLQTYGSLATPPKTDDVN